MTVLTSTDRAHPPVLQREGACLREGVARSHGRERNWARTKPQISTANRPNHNPQHWVEKVRRSITNSETPQLAEQIHAALRQHPGGLTRSQISQTLNHNQPAGQIDHALHALHAAGRVTATHIPTGGRPAQLWTATSPSTQPAGTVGP